MCKPAAVESTSPGLDASKPASNAALARLAPLLTILLALFLFVYPRLLAATAALCAFAVVDSFWSAAECEVVATGDAARLLKSAPALSGVYRPFPGSRQRHICTAMGFVVRQSPKGYTYRRECVQMKDGGFVALDWLHERPSYTPAYDPASKTPLLVICPGLGASCDEAYMQHIMSKGAEHGLEPVLVNYRGGGPLQKPLWSGPTLTSDLKEVLAILRARHPDTVFVGFGCSKGANVLVKYLEEEGGSSLLAGGASLCYPNDPAASDKYMTTTFTGSVYNFILAMGLVLKFKQHANTFAVGGAKGIDAKAAMAARTLRAFDAAITVPAFGYPTIEDYFADCGSDKRLNEVKKPLLWVAAADDPIAIDSCVPRKAIAANPCCALVVTPSGGHMGWMAGIEAPFGAPWPYEGTAQWLAAVAGEAKATAAAPPAKAKAGRAC